MWAAIRMDTTAKKDASMSRRQYVRSLIDNDIDSAHDKKSDMNGQEIRKREAEKGWEWRDVWQGTGHNTPEQRDRRTLMSYSGRKKVISQVFCWQNLTVAT